MEYMRTVGKEVVLEGVGVFSGKDVRVEIHPRHEGDGILFERVDLSPKVVIPLKVENVIGLDGATAITDGEHTILLIEHLLSALHGLGIDAAYIKVYGEEIPLFDGSALPYVQALRHAGYTILPRLKKKFYLRKDFEMQNGNGFIRFRRSLTTTISAKISFPHPLIGEQSFSLALTPTNYLKEVCFARTFGFKSLLEERRKKGILKGGDLTNAIVLDEKEVLNPEGLRTEDEFVRHKVLDLVGDLFVLGRPLVAEVYAELSSHKLHVEALRTLWTSGLLEEVEVSSLTFFLVKKRFARRA
jgi:UDP-3-O-[3-hydroxymyristoyl] N-acetylglucosamine deacetylase